MPQKLNHYVLVVAGMGISLFISSFLLQNLFLDKSPTPYWNSFSDQMVQIKQNTLLAESSIANQILQIVNSIQSAKPPPFPTQTSNPIQPTPVSFFGTISAPPQETISPILLPTSLPLPTPFPPTDIPTSVPISIPTSIPKSNPTTIPTSVPTSTPKPTLFISFPKVVGDPLKQKWYGNGSLACYTPLRFIQVYAAGITPNKCLYNVKNYIDSNLTTVSLLGRKVQVHTKTATAFQAVADTLDQYKETSGTYNFPSKTYKIKNVGTYIFRCNTNASTGNILDTCQPGCVIGTHAFGIAVDINYDENCNGCKNYDMPEEIWKTFEMYGFRWGGHYPLLGSKIDPMHFEYMKDLCEGI